MLTSRQQELLSKLRELHPNLNFDECQPCTTNDRISPSCPTHGKFTKPVMKMIYGARQGCPSCGHKRKNKSREVTKEQLVEATLKRHGDHYDLTDTVMTGTKNTIQVKCKYHGVVSVHAGSFYVGRTGCRLCGVAKNAEVRTSSQEDILTELRTFLGDGYDLSKVKYKNSKSRITIICKTHGEYTAVAGAVLTARTGCKKCGTELLKQTVQKKKSEEYKRVLYQLYGDEYDLSLTEYVNRKTPLIVICKKHGPFTTDPWAFRHGKRGCPYCSNKYLCNDEFRRKAVAVHGPDRYTFDLVHTTKHTFGVLCNVCNNKWMARVQHILEGGGCPVCAVSGFNPAKPAVLYNIEFTLPDNVRVYKIGVTNGEVPSRMVGMKISKSVSFKILEGQHFKVGKSAINKEKRLIREFRDYAYTGKRFLKNGWSEIFTVNPFTYVIPTPET